MKRKIFVVLVILIAGLYLSYAGHASEFTRIGWSMNTLISMKIYSDTDKPLNDAYNLLAELDAKLSMYNSESDIDKINSQAGHEKFNTDSKVIEVIKDSLRVHEISEGVFNPLIGSITRLWKINQADNKIPSREELDTAIKLSDISNLQLDNNSVYLKHEGCVLDLGGIAKGYASTKISDMLKSEGVESGLIDLGGNVQVIGKKPDGSNWVIGVRDPLSTRGAPALVLSVNDTAIITSGNYERYKIVDGKKYSHFFDYKTGESILNDLLSVTVIAPDGSLADGLATAFMASGYEKSLGLLKNVPESVGVIFIRQGEGGNLDVIATKNLMSVITRSKYQVSYVNHLRGQN